MKRNEPVLIVERPGDLRLEHPLGAGRWEDVCRVVDALSRLVPADATWYCRPAGA